YGPDVHVCEAERRCVQNEASELARLAVVLAAGRLQERDVVRGHIGRHALHEQPQREGIRWMAVERLAGAHDVVAEHGLDIVPIGVHLLLHYSQAELTLLSSG